MREDDLAAIEERVEAATEGPWYAQNGAIVLAPGTVAPQLAEFYAQQHVRGLEAAWPFRANAEFAAHAREDVPALIAEVRQLWADLTLAHDEIEDLHDKLLGTEGFSTS